VNAMVKICGLTDAASVTAAVNAGADAVGFVFYEKSPRNLDIASAVELMSAVPGGVTRVAVMLHPDAAFCEQVLAAVKPDVLQTDAADFDYIALPDGVAAWPVIRENKILDFGELPEQYLYEGAGSGKGETVDWTRASSIATHGRMILAGGLTASNVATAIRQVRPWGVDVSSAVESAPGQKDANKIQAFIAAAKAA
jgi:phosphoribosylanthranilate isomerase